MTFTRRLTAAFLAIALACTVAVVAPRQGWAQQDDDAGQPAERPPAIVDQALIDALSRARVLDQWYELSPYSRAASSLVVEAGATYREARSRVISAANDLADRQAGELAVLDGIDSLRETVQLLREFTMDQRARSIVDPERLTPSEAAKFRRYVEQVRNQSEAILVGDGELVAMHESVATIRADLGARVERDADPRGAFDGKGLDGSDYSLILGDLDRVDRALNVLAGRTQARLLHHRGDLGALESDLSELHRLRPLGRTLVEGLPLVTLDAYLQGGAHGIAGCSVDWRLLAGIGRIESIHGTLGGASVATSGQVSPKVFGPLLDGGATERLAAQAEAERLAAEAEAERLEAERAAAAEAAALDRLRRLYQGLEIDPVVPGRSEPESDAVDSPRDAGDGEDSEDSDEEDDSAQGNGFAVIADTDGGALDGNADWDRAVGPMQFIPGTWSLWNRDGDGDGVADPHNFYDATASAAAYLCHLEGRSGASARVFVRGYNDSSSYVSAVLAFADSLARYNLG